MNKAEPIDRLMNVLVEFHFTLERAVVALERIAQDATPLRGLEPGEPALINGVPGRVVYFGDTPRHPKIEVPGESPLSPRDVLSAGAAKVLEAPAANPPRDGNAHAIKRPTPEQLAAGVKLESIATAAKDVLSALGAPTPQEAMKVMASPGPRKLIQWSEDDATINDPDHETVRMALLRLTGVPFDIFAAKATKQDLGDAIVYTWGGLDVYVSFPGNSRIETSKTHDVVLDVPRPEPTLKVLEGGKTVEPEKPAAPPTSHMGVSSTRRSSSSSGACARSARTWAGGSP
jgi:hypothetical protein